MNFTDVIPGLGLGNLKFGSTRELVKKEIGNPTEIEKYALDDDDDDITEAWHYDEDGLSISFDQEHAYVLSSIAISDEKFTLKGNAVIGLSKKEVDELFAKNNWGKLQEDEEEPNLFYVDDISCSLFFVDGVCSELQLSPYIVNNEFAWPK